MKTTYNKENSCLELFPKFFVFDLDDTLYQKHKVINPNGSGVENIKTFPKVKTILTDLKNNNVALFLVTKGETNFQNQKIDRLNIRDLFDKIYICEFSEEKKILFQNIKNNYPLQSGVVMGDRLSVEIRYGNELGLCTIHLKQGKYAQEQSADKLEIPTYEIKCFEELENIISSWRK